ncbi:TPA: Iron-sulfur assembly protein 1 [Trebouxia sp. C0006]
MKLETGAILRAPCSSAALFRSICRKPPICSTRKLYTVSQTSASSASTTRVSTRNAFKNRIVHVEMPASQPSGQAASAAFADALRGRSTPLGATVLQEEAAINFALYSAGGTGVSLCLFTDTDLQNGKVTYEVDLHNIYNKTGDVWHIALPQLDNSLMYGFRVKGDHEEEVVVDHCTMDTFDSMQSAEDTVTIVNPGQRYSDKAVIIDPYARSIVGRRQYGQLAQELNYKHDSVLGIAATWPQMAAPVPSKEDWFDWEGDHPLNIPLDQLIIYEMHVRGFTRHPSANVTAPGTYLGLVEKLDYLQALGVNAIELLPVQEFNELEYYQLIPGTDSNYRYNYWGYSTVGFFAPMARYSQAAAEGRGGQDVVKEFKTMVKECHKRGIEVLMDVVFNHTAEGNERGPTLSFRGLDNRVYYMLAPEGQYYNYSGCGNTFNCNHPVVRKFIVDCLRYWVVEMHVDGFRFDLASILTRAHSQWHKPSQSQSNSRNGNSNGNGLQSMEEDLDQGIMEEGAGLPTGTPLTDPPVIEMISEDPVLRSCKLIAEAWDCDGLNQVGAFPHYGGQWAEWNGHFRDTVRQFVKGTEGPWAAAFAQALSGSPGLYSQTEPAEGEWWANNGGRKWKGGRAPAASINFVTAHDGFSLADLTAYNEKHNDANGEDNRDGESHNLSWNCGEEGETKTPSVLRLRSRQMRNMAAALLLSHGVPMIQMGDEYGHSKGGNNNTYCHDSELNWFNWEQAGQDETGYARFFRCLVNLRKRRPELRRRSFMDGGAMTWHGAMPGEADWTEDTRLVAFTVSSPSQGGLYCAFNTSHRPQTVVLPHWPELVWQAVMDTGKAAPYDFLEADHDLSPDQVDTARAQMSMWTSEGCYPLLPYSSVVLEAVPEQQSQTGRARAASQTRNSRAGQTAMQSPGMSRGSPESDALQHAVTSSQPEISSPPAQRQVNPAGPAKNQQQVTGRPRPPPFGVQ